MSLAKFGFLIGGLGGLATAVTVIGTRIILIHHERGYGWAHRGKPETSHLESLLDLWDRKRIASGKN
jgi:hypothetical protein